MKFPAWADWSRAARRVGWALTLAVVVLLLQSTFWETRVPWALKLAVAAVAVLSAWRPADGLLAVAALVPLGHALATRVWQAYPFALSEAFVLAFLAGYLWRQRRGTLGASAPPDRLVLPSRLFALVVLASCLVQLAVLQVWHDDPLRYAASFADVLATSYLMAAADPRPWVDGRGFRTAGLLLEGVALLRCAIALCRDEPALARRLTNVMIAAGVGVAVLSFSELAEEVLSLDQPFVSAMATRRGSPAIPSVNTTGPYQMLLAYVAIGTAAASQTYRLPGIMAGVICLGAMWLTQTRSAIIAGVAVLAAAAVWIAMVRGVRLRASRAATVAGIAVIAVGVSLVGLYVFSSGTTGESARLSLYLRFQLGETALRMFLSRPFFGVGVGQYELWHRTFGSPELLKLMPVDNAHNYFLWVSAELGLVGIAILLWILGATLARCWSHLRDHELNGWFLGTFAGLAAFIVTWVSGQPLGIPQVAYTFWILLGALAGSSAGTAAVATGDSPHLRLRRLAVAATILVVVGSVPIRAARAIADIDLSRVSYGFYNSGTADGRDFRWAGPRVMFFMRESVGAITLPLAAKLPDTPHGAQVDILVDGRAADRVLLSDREWHGIRINAPRSERPFWRVDLHVTPIEVPADLPENRRRVAVGEISIARRQETP